MIIVRAGTTKKRLKVEIKERSMSFFFDNNDHFLFSMFRLSYSFELIYKHVLVNVHVLYTTLRYS